MKIYTGTGDRGKTGLLSGERINKADARIEAYGDVDELNSVIGAMLSILPEALKSRQRELLEIQSDLFRIGAILATTPESPVMEDLETIDEARIRFLETAIDRMEERLPALRNFILPGGHPSAAWSHVARTVCRRAERHAVFMTGTAESDTLYQTSITYLNRLSDYLFVLARQCNRLTGTEDVPWGR